MQKGMNSSKFPNDSEFSSNLSFEWQFLKVFKMVYFLRIFIRNQWQNIFFNLCYVDFQVFSTGVAEVAMQGVQLHI